MRNLSQNEKSFSPLAKTLSISKLQHSIDREKILSLFALFLLPFYLTGCPTKTYYNNLQMFWITVPKDWKLSEGGWIVSDKGDRVRASRWPFDGPLETFIENLRSAIKTELVGFITEDESWIKVSGRRAWKMIGTLRQPEKNIEQTWVFVLIDGGPYKYKIEIATPSEYFKERKPVIESIIHSFRFELPK